MLKEVSSGDLYLAGKEATLTKLLWEIVLHTDQGNEVLSGGDKALIAKFKLLEPIKSPLFENFYLEDKTFLETELVVGKKKEGVRMSVVVDVGDFESKLISFVLPLRHPYIAWQKRVFLKDKKKNKTITSFSVIAPDTLIKEFLKVFQTKMEIVG